MKVLVLSHLYPSTVHETNGVFVNEQVKELAAQGCDITVVSPVKLAPFPLNKVSAKWKAYADCPYEDTRDGIKVYYPRYISPPKMILFKHTGQFMYKAVEDLVSKLHKEQNFDLIHTHVALPDGAAAYRLSKKLNLPYVLTIHGQDLQKTVHKNEACRREIGKAIENAERLILVSNKLARLKDKFYPEINTPVSVIFNGVNKFFLQKDVVESKGESYFSTEGPKLLSVSNLYTEKGIEDNIRAVKELTKKYKTLEYIIVGKGYDEDRLKNLVSDLGLTNHIRFIGAKKNNEVKQIMRQCDIFTMPSTNESFGVVYIEAMACGKPVIGCYGQGIEDIVEHGKTGFMVNPHSPDEIVQVCEELLTDDDYRAEVGNEAYNVVLKRFTWEIAAKEIVTVYQNSL
ncbi:glycosyltransferase [Bacillus salacetis]|uniref:glycosyltransferase n=1 Tax=Bacillus salacetis TaxID=2315464 RepID=UPI003BA0AD70